MTQSREHILITGASKGIGLALARRYANEGHKLALADIDQDGLASAQSELAKLGGEVRTYVVDIRNQESVIEVAGQIVQDLGHVDILVNNAGTSAFGPLLETTRDIWDQELGVHLSGPFFLIQAIAPHMVERRYGRIVNISSVAALMGPLDLGPYGAAKAGLLGLTRAASLELADYGITVNAIAPGPIKTQLLVDTWPPDALAERAEHLPIRRLGSVDDVVNAVQFLAARSSGFISGVVLPVDGGSVAAGAYMVEVYRRRKASADT